MEFFVAVGILLAFSLTVGLFPFAKDAVEKRRPGAAKWFYRAFLAGLSLFTLWNILGWVDTRDWLRLGFVAMLAVVWAVSRLVESPSQKHQDAT